MKILLLHRAQNNTRFSFETLFSTISEHLYNCEKNNFYAKTYSSFWKDLKAIKKIKCDIIHITGGIGYYAIFLNTKKTILTIHDTNHYEFDLHGIRKWLYGLLFYKIPAANVKYITVVSIHTKKKLITLFNIDPKKIIVIPNCYPKSFKKETLSQKNEIPKILHIGTKANKNLNRLIDAIQDLDIELTIIGKLPKKINQKLNILNINYINKFNLSSTEIYNEYKSCDIVYFASLHEGFGLPIIEANVIGKPVITSNLSPMKDIAGKEACLVNPLNTDEIKESIIKIISNKNYREHLINYGLKNSTQFAPEKIAKQYEKLYRSLTNG